MSIEDTGTTNGVPNSDTIVARVLKGDMCRWLEGQADLGSKDPEKPLEGETAVTISVIDETINPEEAKKEEICQILMYEHPEIYDNPDKVLTATEWNDAVSKYISERQSDNREQQ